MPNLLLNAPLTFQLQFQSKSRPLYLYLFQYPGLQVHRVLLVNQVSRDRSESQVLQDKEVNRVRMVFQDQLGKPDNRDQLESQALQDKPDNQDGTEFQDKLDNRDGTVSQDPTEETETTDSGGGKVAHT